MALWISHLYDEESLSNIPTELPVYIFAGSDDPVGNYGKGPLALLKRLKASGLKEVTLNIYEGNRHECLNETNRSEVVNDLMKFCLGTIGGGS
jgi:alpha-beta hydrolase superfamily lysophospholipase